MILLQILFWFCFLGLFHSYLLYPFLLKVLAAGKKRELPKFADSEELPVVSVLMSLYNEEKVVAQKMDSLFSQDYPQDKLFFFVGSDASSDRTLEILQPLASSHSNLFFFPYKDRRGKPQVINNLASEAFLRLPPGPDHLILITDANVILAPDTIRKLVRNFKEERIALVDSHMVNVGMQKPGISRSEKYYISREVHIKHHEGILWQSMVGPFGGCYAMRSTFFVPIPAHFLVDDFYLAMRVFEQGGKAINDLEAVCYEAVSHALEEEYRRKRRISAGNFQNLVLFFKLWFPPVGPTAFAIFSHKILRWIGPFLLLGTFLSSGILAFGGNLLFQGLFILQLFFMVVAPGLDAVLAMVGVHWPPLRNLRYFLFMNLALLEGFWLFLKGIQHGAWEPPKRV